MSAPESVDPGTTAGLAATADDREARLHGDKLGTAHLTSMVIGAAAPVANVTVALSLGIALGVGAGMPGIVVISTLLFLLFAIGYTRALPLMRNAGAFYVYIARGLGKVAGVSAAFVSTICYICFAVVLTALTGYLADASSAALGGPHVSWIWWSLLAVTLTAWLSWRQINVGAGVLTVILALEFLSVTVLLLAILFQRGFSSFSLTVFVPHTVFHGAVGVSMIYAVTVLIGFEATAVYSEEARNPLKTIPRATFAVILISGLMYVFGAWAIIAGEGAARVQEVAAQAPVGFVFDEASRFVGSWFGDFLLVQSCVSVFAGIVAVHNSASRYLFAVARDGFLPSALAQVHPRHGVPIRAGLVNLVAIVVVPLGFWAAGQDPVVGVSTTLQGIGNIGVLSLYALTSCAIAAIFIRRREVGFATVVAPLISAVFLVVFVVWATFNYHLMSGTENNIINHLPWALVAVAAIGIGAALWTRKYRPERYQHIATPVKSM